MLRLGVLDQSPVRSGGAVADAIHETLELAELCDRLGYHRYWLAEHHSTPGLAGSSPEVLIGQVAARTSRIRVGSGGVMLQHYSSLKVAESFRVLETLFPGRIDLGIGRAPGSDQLTARALRENGNLEDFPQQISDLQGFLHGTLPPGHVYAPRASAAVFVVCADTETEAQRLAKSRQLFIVRLYTGRAGLYPSIEEAETYPYTERELAILNHAQQRTVAGNPEQVRERLEALAADYEADELIVVTITHDPKARRRSYELLAKAFGLEESSA